MPDFITGKTIDLPPARVEKPAAKKHNVKPNNVNGVCSRVSKGAANTPDYAALQNKLSESQKQINQLETQRQSVQQQLDDKNQQLAALSHARPEVKASEDAHKPQLTDLLNQNAALKKQVTTLTASQISNSLELAAAKALDSQAVLQLKKQLAESQNNAAALTKQIADLTTKQAANEKALATAQSEGGKTLTQVEQQLTESQTRNADLMKQLATVNQSRNENEKSAGQVQASLTESQNQVKDLLAKNAALIAEDKRKAEHIAAAQQSLAESQKQRDALNKSWQDASGKVKEQEKQLAELRNQKPAAAATPEPKSQIEIRSYALGALWGQEVNGAMGKVKADGIIVELSQVMSGVSDSLNGKFRIPKQKIMEQLDAMNKNSMAKSKPTASSGSENFIQTFSKKPGTKRADMGYYYRILNKGDGKITASDVVGISVKESLASGKVIKDMTKTGKVLSLPLSGFPPLFSSAINHISSKGKLIMAVPPELAYGEQGRPPEIPPNSTMVYEITVVNVQPSEGK